MSKFNERRKDEIGEVTDACFRPLGLSLAILSTAIGYGLIPMMPLLPIIWSRVARRDIGIEILGGSNGLFAIGLGFVTLIICVLAWRGRPPGVQFVMLALVWVATAYLGFRIVQSMISQPEIYGLVGGTLSNVNGLICQLPILIFVPLYVTWYLNRAPARNFYACRNR